MTTGPASALETPFELVAPYVRAQRRTKADLLRGSRELEAVAAEHPDAVVIATFQVAEQLSARSRAVYRALAHAGTAVLLLSVVGSERPAEDLLVGLQPGDLLATEWDVVVLGPAVARAFVARDLDPARAASGDPDRAFSWCDTDDPDLVMACAEALVRRAPAQHPAHGALARIALRRSS